MKRFLITLERIHGTARTLEADVEFHETDCPNLARKLLRGNACNGTITFTSDLARTIIELIDARHKLGMTTQHTVHIKRAGRNDK